MNSVFSHFFLKNLIYLVTPNGNDHKNNINLVTQNESCQTYGKTYGKSYGKLVVQNFPKQSQNVEKMPDFYSKNRWKNNRKTIWFSIRKYIGNGAPKWKNVQNGSPFWVAISTASRSIPDHRKFGWGALSYVIGGPGVIQFTDKTRAWRLVFHTECQANLWSSQGLTPLVGIDTTADGATKTHNKCGWYCSLYPALVPVKLEQEVPQQTTHQTHSQLPGCHPLSVFCPGNRRRWLFCWGSLFLILATSLRKNQGIFPGKYPINRVIISTLSGKAAIL